MRVTFKEHSVKKRSMFSLGMPSEPKLNPGELFIYFDEEGNHYQVQPHETPVTNAFLARNKIIRCVRVLGGPYIYQLNDEFYTRDTRKKIRVDVRVQLKVVDGYSLYRSGRSDINAFFGNIFPVELSRIIANYDISEIVQIQRLISDLETFPEFKVAIRNMGLLAEQFTIMVAKDAIEEELDIKYRIEETTVIREQEIEVIRTQGQTEIDHIKDMAEIERNMKKLLKYRQIYEVMGDVEVALQMIPEDDRPLVQLDWKKQGILQIEEPKQEQQAKSDVTPFD